MNGLLQWWWLPALVFWGLVLSRIFKDVVRAVVRGYRKRRDRKSGLQAERLHRLAVSRDLPTKGIPDFYLDKPRLAIFWFGKEAVDAYLRITEPKHRNSAGYPPDWEWRRYVVLRRDTKTCKGCGAGGGELHVHHIKPISNKGTHDLGNLLTLCRRCHSVEHPGNELLARTGRSA